MNKFMFKIELDARNSSQTDIILINNISRTNNDIQSNIYNNINEIISQ